MFNIFLIVALVLRIVLMPISAHSDLFFINEYPNLLTTNGVLDIYSYMDLNLGISGVSYYPPLAYFTIGTFQYFYKIISPSFSIWMNEILALDLNHFKGQAANFIEAAPNVSIYRDLFLAKLPYLIFEIGIVFLLLKFVRENILKKGSIIVWLFNPALIYSTYIFGQFEIIPSFFLLLSYYLLRKNLNLAILFLGIAAAYKNYAFAFLPIVVALYSRSWSQTFKLILIAACPYLVGLIPTLINQPSEAIYTLLPKVYLYEKTTTTWAAYSRFIKYFLIILGYILIVLVALVVKFKDKWNSTIALSTVAIILILSFAPTISFHYLLWSTPILVLHYKRIKTLVIILTVQALSLASYKLMGNHLQAGLFAPISPDYFAKFMPVNDIVNRLFPYTIISSTGFFVFFIINIFIIVKILSELIFSSELTFKRVSRSSS